MSKRYCLLTLIVCLSDGGCRLHHVQQVLFFSLSKSIPVRFLESLKQLAIYLVTQSVASQEEEVAWPPSGLASRHTHSHTLTEANIAEITKV